MVHKIVDHDKIGARPAPQTGVYAGAGGDSRFFKAGAPITAGYTFSHLPGAPLSKENQTKRDAQVAAWRKARMERLAEAQALLALR